MSKQSDESILDLSKSIYESTNQQGDTIQIKESQSIYIESEHIQQKKQQDVKRSQQTQKVQKIKQEQTRYTEIFDSKNKIQDKIKYDESIQAYKEQIQLHQDNISKLKKQLREKSSKIQKLEYEIKKQQEQFLRSLGSIRKDRLKIQKEKQNFVNEITQKSQNYSTQQKVVLNQQMNSRQRFNETMSNKFDQPESENPYRLQILQSSIKDLQQKWSKQIKFNIQESNTKNENIIHLQKDLFDLQQQYKQLKSQYQNVQEQKKLVNDIIIQKDKALEQKDVNLRLLTDEVHQLKQINHKIQSKLLQILANNFESNKLLNEQLIANQNKIYQKILEINNKKYRSLDQLLEIKADLYDKIQQIAYINRITEQKQKIIQFLSATIREKDQYIQAIENRFEQSIIHYDNFINAIIRFYQNKSRQVTTQNQQFLSQLILSKQTRWQTLASIHQSKLTLSNFMNEKSIMNEQILEKKCKNLTEKYEKDLLNIKLQQKQLLQQSQSQCMQLCRQIQLNQKQINEMLKQQKCLESQLERYRQVFYMISHQNSLNELIEQLQNTNKNKDLDGLLFTFTYLQDIIQNGNKANKEIQQKINRQMLIIAQLNKYNQERQVKIQNFINQIYELNKEKQSFLNNNLLQLQEKEKQIEEIRYKLIVIKQTQRQMVSKVSVLIDRNKQLSDQVTQLKSSNSQANEVQDIRDNQISKYLAIIAELNDKVKYLYQKITFLTNENLILKQNNQILSQTKEKLIQKSQDLNQKINILSNTQRLDKEIINLKQQNNRLKKQIQQLGQNKQVDIESSYQQLYQHLKQEKYSIETQLQDLRSKYEKLKNSKQQIKQLHQTKPQVKNIEVVRQLNNFFMMFSLIQVQPHGKQFILSMIQQYCQSRVHQVEMIFKMDDNNKTNFQNTFKPTDINQGVYLHLFMKKNYIFGFVTFHSKIKGTPSCIMFSVNNSKCVFRDEQKYQTSAFKYEYNTLYFGNSEAKFKSGFKNFTASDTLIRKYFAKYSRAQIFGEDFKQVLEINQFEIHKILL